MVYLGMSLDGSLMLWMLIYPLSIFATLISTSESTEVINSDKNASTNAIQDSSAINILKDLTPAQKSLLYLISELALRKTEDPIQNVIDMNRNQKSTMKSIVADTTHDAMADVHQHQTEGNQAEMSTGPADIVGINAFSESSKSDNQDTEFEESETTTEDSATLTVSSSQEAKGHINANVNPSSQTIKTEYSSTSNLETINTKSVRLSHISDTFDEVSLIGAVKDGANAPIHQTYSSDDDSHKTSSVDAIGKGNDMSRQKIMKTGKRKPATRVVSKIKRDFPRVAGTFGVDSAVERENVRYSQYQSDRKHGKRPLGDPAFHSNNDKRLVHVQQKKKYDYLKKQHTTGSYSDLQGHRKILGVDDQLTPLTAQHTARHSKQSGTTKPPSVFYFEHVRSKGLVGYKAESFDEQKMIRKSSNRNSYNPSSSFDLISKAVEASMFTFPKVHDDRKFFDFSDTSNKRRLKKITAPRSSFTNSDNYGAGESIINNMMQYDRNTLATRRCGSCKRGKTDTGIARLPNQHKLISTCDSRPALSIPIQKPGVMKFKTVKHKAPTSASTSKINNRSKKLNTSEATCTKSTDESSPTSVTYSAATSTPDLVLDLSVNIVGLSEMLGRLETLATQLSVEPNVRKSNLN